MLVMPFGIALRGVPGFSAAELPGFILLWT
ncbi:hypothetical protein ABH944_001737 [Caballeronia udeis]|uniref:Uncharacterized protein n=1 Tax=Caballeronia udeis TaxID=1232866 RepID=A0ABW8MDF7_9BURK